MQERWVNVYQYDRSGLQTFGYPAPSRRAAAALAFKACSRRRKRLVYRIHVKWKKKQ